MSEPTNKELIAALQLIELYFNRKDLHWLLTIEQIIEVAGKVQKILDDEAAQLRFDRRQV